MSRIPAELAKQLDRLSYRAHRFHRFAHHPLCREYAGEVIPLGRRTKVCRGCSFVAAGGLVGGALAVILGGPVLVAGALVMAAWGWLAVATFARPWRAGLRRSKVWSRFFPAVGIGYAVVCGLLGGGPGLALVGGSGLALAVFAMRYRQRGPNRGPCATCPERSQARPCRGFAPIVRRERAFRRLAEQKLTRAGW